MQHLQTKTQISAAGLEGGLIFHPLSPSLLHLTVLGPERMFMTDAT